MLTIYKFLGFFINLFVDMSVYNVLTLLPLYVAAFLSQLQFGCLLLYVVIFPSTVRFNGSPSSSTSPIRLPTTILARCHKRQSLRESSTSSGEGGASLPPATPPAATRSSINSVLHCLFQLVRACSLFDLLNGSLTESV